MSQTKPIEEAIKTAPVQAVKPRRGWLLDLVALLFFGVMAFVLLWPLSAHLGTSTTNEGDALQQIWSMGWATHTLLHDPANLFNGNIFYPYLNTLAYSDALLAQTFQGLPVYLATGDLVVTYGVLTLFSFILSGWGTYLLVKEVGGSRAGGLVAGMVFAFASYKIGHLSQLNLLSTQWLPLCFLFLHRLLRQDAAGRLEKPLRQGWWNALGLAGCFILNALSTYYYLFYITPLLLLYFLVYQIGWRRWPSRYLWLKLAGAGLVAGLVILPTFIPYIALVAEQSAERTPRDVEEFSANYRFYLGATPNNLLWGKSLARFAGSGGERALFGGALAYLLAFGGLVGPLAVWLYRKVRRRMQVKGNGQATERWAWALIGLFSFLMSLGWTFHLRGWDVPGLYRLFYLYFPGWVALRAAVRYSVFVLLAVAVLAGLAVAWLSRQDWVRWRKSPGIERPAYARATNAKSTKGTGTGKSRLSSVHLLDFSGVARFSMPGGLVGVALTTLLLAGTFFEYRSDISYINPNILPHPPEVYQWLAQPENAGMVLELPAPPDPYNPPSIRDYYSTFNWQPLIGGVSGYLPQVMPDLDRLINEFPSPQSLSVFQGLEVRWLVFHEADENTPWPAGQWEKTLARLAKTPQVKLVKDFPRDKIQVYELAPDPWLRRAWSGLPVGADVIVSDYRLLQPTLIELGESLLRRDGHNLYGSDRAGYRYLKPAPAGRPVVAGLFAADEDPTLYGFDRQDQTGNGPGLTFYQRRDKLYAAYDLAHDPKLSQYQALSGPLELKVDQDGLEFQGNRLGQGLNLDGEGRVNLLLSSFGPQTIQINGQPVNLAGGLTRWSSDKLAVGQTVRLEPASGQTLYLERAELVGFDPARPAGLTPVNGSALVQGTTINQANKLSSKLMVWTPPLSETQPGQYILTLDIYRRPWGTHPSGHFATYSIAITGGSLPHSVTLDFDPTTRQAQATLDSAGVGIGQQVFEAAGDGSWTAFLTLRRSNPANPQDFPLVGQTRLYDFDLSSNRLTATNLLSARQVMLPPLVIKSGQ